jgi:hypothetical protein
MGIRGPLRVYDAQWSQNLSSAFSKIDIVYPAPILLANPLLARRPRMRGTT